MNLTPLRTFKSPAVWKSTDFPTKHSFALDLKPQHIKILKTQLTQFKKSGGKHKNMSVTTFPLSNMANDIAAWRSEVYNGRGMILFRGLPVDLFNLEDLKTLYLGFGVHFGRPVSQSNMGELVADVINVGDKDMKERAYRSSRELMLHTDRADHIAMLCIRPAIKGGLSGYASALNIHNIMLEERPDLLKYLYRGYYHHRFGEQPRGESPITTRRIPVFSVTNAIPTVILIRGYIDLAVSEGYVKLSNNELEALDYLTAVSERKDVRLDLLMEPGEILFVNNCVILHSRTDFEDSINPALRRHLLRLWLRQDDRPAAEGVIVHKGRAGIEKQIGKGTYYNGGTVA